MDLIYQDWRRLAATALAIAAASLGAALISQYVFGLIPCTLCIYQRWPYVAAIVFAAAALLLRENKPLSIGALALAGLATDIGIGLGVWHSGVEWGWFPPPGCEGSLAVGGLSLEDLMSRPVETPCDARESFFLGLSMANWNVLVSISLSLLFAAALLERLGVRLVPAGAYSSSSASQ